MSLVARIETHQFFSTKTHGTAARRAALVPVLLLALGGTAHATLYIGGSPTKSVTVDKAYAFQPWATDSIKATLKFHVSNMPAWATFDALNGAIKGTAKPAGTYRNISISVTDGHTTVTLPAFSITVTSGSTTTSSLPTISGSPPTAVVVGTPYNFTPKATGPSGAKLTFSVNTHPSWASFNSGNGELSGTPAAGNVGTTSNIVISVSDVTASAKLAPFAITVTQVANGSATVSWTAPTQNTNGSPLTNLAGYVIEYGTSPSALTQRVQIANPGVTSYLVSNLAPGTYYFGVAAYSSAGTQSVLSNVGEKSVQ